MTTLKRVVQVLCVLSSTAFAVQAQEGPRPEYGPEITLEMAKKDCGRDVG